MGDLDASQLRLSAAAALDLHWRRICQSVYTVFKSEVSRDLGLDVNVNDSITDSNGYVKPSSATVDSATTAQLKYREFDTLYPTLSDLFGITKRNSNEWFTDTADVKPNMKRKLLSPVGPVCRAKIVWNSKNDSESEFGA